MSWDREASLERQIEAYKEACLGMSPAQVVAWRKELWTEMVMHIAQEKDFPEKMLKLLDPEQGETV